MHYVAQTNKGDELFEYIVNKLATLDEPQIASIIWKKDDSGARPIHWAAERNPRILEAIITKFGQFYKYEFNELLDDPIPVNVKDSKSETPLYYAALEGQLEVIIIFEFFTVFFFNNFPTIFLQFFTFFFYIFFWIF